MFSLKPMWKLRFFIKLILILCQAEVGAEAEVHQVEADVETEEVKVFSQV